MNVKNSIVYRTKVCPRCGAVLYADMQVCYGCLYEYSGEETGLELLPEPESRPQALPVIASGRGPGMLIQTAQIEVWVSVPEEGMILGRDPDSDVVLHNPAVARRQLSVTPTPDGMEAHPLGGENPTLYEGKPLVGATVVPYGDTLDLLGTLLTMTAPK